MTFDVSTSGDASVLAGQTGYTTAAAIVPTQANLVSVVPSSTVNFPITPSCPASYARALAAPVRRRAPSFSLFQASPCPSGSACPGPSLTLRPFAQSLPGRRIALPPRRSWLEPPSPR